MGGSFGFLLSRVSIGFPGSIFVDFSAVSSVQPTPIGELCSALIKDPEDLLFLFPLTVLVVFGSAVSVTLPNVAEPLSEDPVMPSMFAVTEPPGIETFPEEFPVPPVQPTPAADPDELTFLLPPASGAVSGDSPLISVETVPELRGDTAFLPDGSAIPSLPPPEDSPDSPNSCENGFSPPLSEPFGTASGLCFPFGSVPASPFPRLAPPDEAVPS